MTESQPAPADKFDDTDQAIITALAELSNAVSYILDILTSADPSRLDVRAGLSLSRAETAIESLVNDTRFQRLPAG